MSRWEITFFFFLHQTKVRKRSPRFPLRFKIPNTSSMLKYFSLDVQRLFFISDDILHFISTRCIPISVITMLAVVGTVQKNLSMGWSGCIVQKEHILFYKCFIVTQKIMGMPVHMEVIFWEVFMVGKGRKRDCPLKLINLLSDMGSEVKCSPEWNLQVCIV